jgi:hypothetical protein
MSIFKETLEKIKQQQQALAILVFTLVAAMIWIGASLFTSQQKTGISKDLLKLAKPLTPSINQEVIQRLRQKEIFLDSQLQDFPIYIIKKDKNQNERVVEMGTELEEDQGASNSTK